MASKVAEAVHELIQPQCDELGYELVDVEYAKEGAKYILRIFIDKPDGVTLDDCQILSRRIDPLLDEHDPVPGSYYLEVSSPGLDRPLKRQVDFVRFTGSKIKVKTYSAINNSRTFTGVLLNSTDEKIQLQQDGQEVTIPFSQIAKANLVPEI